MKIILNGVEKVVNDEISIAFLIEELGLQPQTMVAERNKQIVQHQDFGNVVLEDGDVLEFIRFVGGG